MVFFNSFISFTNIWVLKDSKMLFFKQNNLFKQTQVWEVDVVSLKFHLLFLRYIVCKIENCFYWPFYIHCKYVRAQRFESACFFTKIACFTYLLTLFNVDFKTLAAYALSRHSFKTWTCLVWDLILFYRKELCAR